MGPVLFVRADLGNAALPALICDRFSGLRCVQPREGEGG
jgi:hypothetical protein